MPLLGRLLAMVGVGTVAVVAGVLPTVSGATRPCKPYVATLQSAKAGAATVTSLAAFDAGDAWEVGFTATAHQHPFAEHWDGGSWTKAALPSAGGIDTDLEGISGVSSDDVWAVGERETANFITRTLIEHWDGTSWSIVPSPSGGSASADLSAVSADAADDAWAVGTEQPLLAEHYNGTVWSVRAMPAPSPYSVADGVWADSPSDAWAVGYTASNIFAEHWNGSSWHLVTTAATGTPRSYANGISGSGPDDVWIGGETFDSLNNSHPLVEHWNGSTWSVSLSSTTAGGYITAIDALGPGDVWAAGYNGGIPILEHWDGITWTAFPTTTSSGTYLDAVASGGGAVFLGGDDGAGSPSLRLVERMCPLQLDDTGFSPASASVPLGDAELWSLPLSNDDTHTVTDASSASAFGSSSLGPGYSYTTFLPAGTYSVSDPTSGGKQTLRVAPIATPKTGGVSTSFDIRIAPSTGPPPGPFVLDVQILRPGTTTWSLLTTTTATDVTFTPDAGTGVYKLRVRVRNTSLHKQSLWSPPASVTVS
jgi:hypothetical protein